MRHLTGPTSLSALSREPRLKLKSLISSCGRGYTNQQIIIAVGGGGYSLERALFNPKDYTNGEAFSLTFRQRASQGGMLKAFGNLFQSRRLASKTCGLIASSSVISMI